MRPLKPSDIRRLLELLNEELRKSDTTAELFLVGGAVMCLAYSARPSTRDIDAVFRPTPQVREAAARVAARVAARAHVDPHWLNDGVKGFMSAQGEFAPFLELDHLHVMVAQPEYLLAMKCLSMRIGAEFRDEDDIRGHIHSRLCGQALNRGFFPRRHTDLQLRGFRLHGGRLAKSTSDVNTYVLTILAWTLEVEGYRLHQHAATLSVNY